MLDFRAKLEEESFVFHQRSVAELEDCINASSEETSILIDLDETLFLRNSTEEYLNTLQPRVLGAILLIILDIIKPWNWLPQPLKGEPCRDWLRVIIATVFFPWTLILWQKRAQKLAQSYANQQLISMLAQKPVERIIVATLGFDWIVRPIIKHLPLEVNQVVACRFWQGGVDRVKGKYQLVADVLDPNQIAQAIAITDSQNDSALLAAVAQPCLVIWPEAQYIPALSRAYIPFLYLERGKRPGQRYFLRVILGDDWLVLVLAASWLSPQPFVHAAMLLFFLLSFWCVYEVGYLENDRVAEKFEKKPVLSNTYLLYKDLMKWWQPWVWAIIFAIPGLMLLELTDLGLHSLTFFITYPDNAIASGVIDGLAWISLLALLRASYWVYNYINKPTRVWLYIILQVYKTFGFLLLTVTNLVGTLLFSSQVLARWISYFTYRYSHKDWQGLPGELIRCVMFGFLLFAIALGTQDISLIFNGQAVVIFLWCLYRGRRQLNTVWSQVHSIHKDEWEVKS